MNFTLVSPTNVPKKLLQKNSEIKLVPSESIEHFPPVGRPEHKRLTKLTVLHLIFKLYSRLGFPTSRFPSCIFR